VNDYDLLELGELVEFYRESKKRFDDDAEFRERSRKAVVDLQSGDDEAKIAWKFLCNKSRIEFEIIYALLDVRFDEERGESFYNPFLSQVVEDLDKAGLLVEDGGAKCVFLDGFTNKEGEPLPLIVQKSDGGYNYATTDLAAVRYRIEKDEANRLIYVTDAGQANHFAQVFQVARRASWIPEDIEINHVPFGLVQGEDGKKLKTRSGETVKLKDLLDEAIIRARADLENRLKVEERQETDEFIANAATVVGISAVKYADLSQNRTSNYIFSYDRMLALQGNTAPYMLYAYARIQGISRKGEVDFEQLGDSVAILLQHETELTLAKHLLQLDDVIYAVEQDLFPNRLCEYLFQLSQKFNQFYDRTGGVPVLNAEEPLRTSRLVLCNLTARTLKLGLSLLGIQVLDRM
jgi:arginyl-tRNA synthetase